MYFSYLFLGLFRFFLTILKNCDNEQHGMVGLACPSDSKYCQNVFVIPRAAPLTVRARTNEKFLMQILLDRVLTFH